MSDLQAPFPWFGGKSRAASLIWSRIGDVPNFVEPFAGSLAVLLGRPSEPRIETVNDLDGYVANFWRALQSVPDEVAEYADQPVNECDLHARHLWLVGRKDKFAEQLMADPDFFDAKVAGWWVWGICCWIAGGWCSGRGPWVAVDGVFTKSKAGVGVKRQLPHLGNAGMGVHRTTQLLVEWMRALADRLRRVRVCCGDWSRICGPSPTTALGITGVVLDPPYADTKRCGEVYRVDSLSVAHDVREWAIAHGDDPKMRIALCGYEGEHNMPESWECVPWKARGGYGSQSKSGNENAARERIWFSPHCLTVRDELKSARVEGLRIVEVDE